MSDDPDRMPWTCDEDIRTIIWLTRIFPYVVFVYVGFFYVRIAYVPHSVFHPFLGYPWWLRP